LFYEDLKLSFNVSYENLISGFLYFTSSDDIFVVFEKGFKFSKNQNSTPL